MKFTRLSAFALVVLTFIAPLAYGANHVTFALDWLVSGVDAGYYAAKDNGYYKDNDIDDISIARGFGSGDTIKRVASGSATFGLVDTGTLISALSHAPIPVRIVAMIYDEASTGILYNAGSGIREPKDLEGKTVAHAATGASTNLFPAFLAANHIERSKIHEIVVDPSAFLSMLLSHQADAVLEQGILLGRYARVAKRNGMVIKSMPYADYGMPAYGNAIIVNTETISKHPKLVRGFVKATLNGVAFAFNHPKEATDMLLKKNPQLDRQESLDEILALKGMDNTKSVRTHGLGYVDQKRMAATVDTVTAALKLRNNVEPDGVYTDKFLPDDGSEVKW